MEDKIHGKNFFFWKNVSHQCCLLDRFHCCWSDSRNAVRARTLCAHLIGILRWPPGPQNACGCRGRGTVMKPGPEAPSPARPAGTAPRDALEGACHWRKCHWSCCNIWSETNRDGRETFINARALLSVHSLTALSSALHAHSFSLKVCHQTQKNSVINITSPQNNDSSNTTGALSSCFKNCFHQRLQATQPLSNCDTLWFCSSVKFQKAESCTQQSCPCFSELSFPQSGHDWIVTSPPSFPSRRR